MSTHLNCNYPSCTKYLQEYAWITSCSHVFCDEHGLLEFSSKRTNKCPLCYTELPNQLDIIKADINPSEQYKSMILAGQRPEVVIEIASRALAFWHYQLQLQSLRDKQDRMAAEKRSQESLNRILHEKSAMELDLKNAEKEMEELQKKNSDLDNLLAEKNRQNLKLSSALDSLRCRLAEQDARQQLQSRPRHADNNSGSQLGFYNTNPNPALRAPTSTPHHFDSVWSQSQRMVKIPFTNRESHQISHASSDVQSVGVQAGMRWSALQAVPRGNRPEPSQAHPAPAFNLNF